MSALSHAIAHDLRRVVGDDLVVAPVPPNYLADATEARGVVGAADALVLPRTSDGVAAVVAWCYEQDVAVIPRGGGTGFAGGAVPLEGGVLLSLERLQQVRSFDPLLWRAEVEAGLTTATVRRLARESGLLFPPDPGAAEQSQIGGNVSTNAGGPHAFKYGVTGNWVMGIEAVLAPGETVTVGGPFRKDVAGYDLKKLLVGSEGTLGIVTSVWLRLIPAPEAAASIVSFHDGIGSGCDAIERVLGSGIPVAALEYLDPTTAAVARGAFPVPVPDGAFMIVAEVDGPSDEVARLRKEVLEALGDDGDATYAPSTKADIAALWRWRDGVSIAVQAVRGGKVSEDIVVPLDRLAEAIEGTVEIGRRNGLTGCSWGHAGDGNLHSTFMVRRNAPEETARATAASQELFEMAARLGGSISGEHGVGFIKNGELARVWSPQAIALHGAIKQAFDPKGLLNPGKKLAG